MGIIINIMGKLIIKERGMGSEDIYNPRNSFMKDSLKIISIMALGGILLLEDIMRGSGKMVSNMGKGNLFREMDRLKRANGKIVNLKVDKIIWNIYIYFNIIIIFSKYI